MGAQGPIEGQILYTFYKDYAFNKLTTAGVSFRVVKENDVVVEGTSTPGTIELEIKDNKVIKATVV